MEGNLTKGPIMKTLVVSSSDHGIIVSWNSLQHHGHGVDRTSWPKAVAGVGVGGMFTWLSQGLASMARMGGQVQVAQCIGRGDRKKAHGFAQAAVQLAAVMGIMYAVICLVFAEQMVGFFQLEDAEAHAAALAYTKIACGLIVFSFLTLTLTGLYTAQGDSKRRLSQLYRLVMNMILDPVLILGPGPFPKFGVAGAAVATVTAQAIVMSVMVVGIAVQKKENVLKGTGFFAKIPSELLRGICRIDPDRASGNGVLRDFHDLNTDGVRVRRGGGRHAEKWRTDRVDLLNTADGFAAALNAFVAQNYGAGEKERVRKGYHVSLWTVGLWGILVSAIFICFPGAIADVFFHEPKAVEIAIGYLVIIGFGEAFMCVELTTIGALSGLGRTRLCSVISVAFTSARIPLAVILSESMGLHGIWWAFRRLRRREGIILLVPFSGS